jgi:hypothetical protein
MNTYAGIGSRTTPITLAARLGGIARKLESLGWILHSGGAKGADTFFEHGVQEPRANARIFLPWCGFNKHWSDLYEVSERAHEIAREFHPAYHRLSLAKQLLMARNSYQVLGPSLDAPVACVVCWAPVERGQATGGTSQAVRIATAYGVSVFNLFEPRAFAELAAFVRERSPGFDPKVSA